MSSQKAKKPTNQAIEQEEVLQAIVILESYTNKFKPLSTDTPECLLPLLNKPLIDYTLEFLKEQGVEEIHLFCTQHYEKIKRHLTDGKWSPLFRSDVIQLQGIPGCSTLNESMRQINMIFSSRSLSRSHFILITAPSILAFNIHLKKNFELHKERYRANKNAIMTVVCAKKSNDLNLDFNNRLNQTYLMLSPEMAIFNYFNSYDNNADQEEFSISSETMKYLNKLDSRPNLKVSSKLTLRTDLLDTQIYFCTAHVLNLFEDNFHAQSMSAFLDTIISDTIASNLIYCDILNRSNGAYLATINSLNSYYFQTMKLLQRSREFNLASGREYLIENRIESLNVFLNRASLPFNRNVFFRRNVFVQSGVEIGDGSVLINCFIGKNCKIGSNVNISNSIVFENCVIGNDVNLNACILGSNAKVGNNCKIVENTLIGNNCEIKDNTAFSSCGIYHVPEDEASGFSDDDEDTIGYVANRVQRLNVNGLNYEVCRCFVTESDYEDDECETDSEIDSLALRKRKKSEKKKKKKDLDKVYESLRHFYVWPIKKSKVINNKLDSSNEDYEINTNDGDHDEDDEYYELDDNEEEDTESENELSDDDIKDSESDDDNDDDDDDDDDDNGSDEDVDDDEKKFETELIKSLQRPLIEKSYDIENLKLEISGLKAAHYQEFKNVCILTAKLLLELPISSKSLVITYKGLTKLAPNYMDLILIVIERFKDLMKEYYCRNKESQYILLNSIVDFFLKKQVEENSIVQLLLKLNQDFELLDEIMIISWHRETLMSTDEEKKGLLNIKKFTDFIDWLQNADEDDDDDDDE